MTDQLQHELAERADWAEWQNDLLVAAYFDLHARQSAGEYVNKANLYRELSIPIARRPKSIERKMQNVSAVLEAIDYEWATGLAPLRKYQTSLTEAVQRYLDDHPSVAYEQVLVPSPGIHPIEVIAPALRPPKIIDPSLERIARKYNRAERDFQNRETGRLGEEFVFNLERQKLVDAGLPKLAEKVEWTARDKGDGVGYDIKSFNRAGDERLIEVKATTGDDRTPFFITRTEYDVAQTNSARWRLVRLFDLNKKPAFFRLKPPLLERLNLSVDTWRADFG